MINGSCPVCRTSYGKFCHCRSVLSVSNLSALIPRALNASLPLTFARLRYNFFNPWNTCEKLKKNRVFHGEPQYRTGFHVMGAFLILVKFACIYAA